MVLNSTMSFAVAMVYFSKDIVFYIYEYWLIFTVALLHNFV